MSSLICFSTADLAVIATDTLGVDNYGKPYLFTNKATYLPTLKSVICGTGVGGFHSEWAEIVNSKMILLGIDNLNYHAPRSLSELWEDYKKRYSLHSDITTSVYVVGFSMETNAIKIFSYKSATGFKSEELDHGWFFKPECSVPSGEDLFQVIKEMMFEQRSIQDALPHEQKVYIGGQVNAIILERQAVRHINIADFPDFNHQIHQIFKSE